MVREQSSLLCISGDRTTLQRSPHECESQECTSVWRYALSVCHYRKKYGVVGVYSEHVGLRFSEGIDDDCFACTLDVIRELCQTPNKVLFDVDVGNVDMGF